jgi:NAD(P)-dependent dehydrogenase (short-subunit alcohol dehydrogenase family)
VLRDGLLDDVTVAFAGDAPAAVRDACARLGAGADGLPDVVVCAAAAAHAAAGGGLDGLRAGSEQAFAAARDAATAWIEAGRGGKVVFLAPGPEAPPLRAALENLARTLSVEWARYGIHPVAILPGAATTDDELADLVAFLASRAGDYYSGCAFTLA